MLKERSFNPRLMWLSIAVSIVLVWLYPKVGFFLHIALIPIIGFVIFRELTDFFPSLSLLLISETYIIYIILCTVFLFVLFNWRKLYNSELRTIMLLIFLVLPFIVWLVFQKLIVHGESIILVSYSIQYYLAFFAFLYGFQISKGFMKYHFYGLAFVLLFSLIFHLFFVGDQTVRLLFFLIPFFFSLFFSIKPQGNTIRDKLAMILLWCMSLVLLFHIFITSTFTIFFSVLLSSIIVFLRVQFNLYKIVEILTSKWIIILSIGFMMFVIFEMKEKEFKLEQFNAIDAGTAVKETDVINFALYKIYKDRGPLWVSIFDEIIVERNFLPIVKEKPIHVTNYLHNLGGTISIGAHNIYLLLFQKYGIISGLLLCIAYGMIVLKSGAILREKNVSSYLIVLSSTVFSVGVIGGIFGQFVLVATFSFLFMGLAGILFGLKCSQRY